MSKVRDIVFFSKVILNLDEVQGYNELTTNKLLPHNRFGQLGVIWAV